MFFLGQAVPNMRVQEGDVTIPITPLASVMNYTNS